jgi:hypothetical protein
MKKETEFQRAIREDCEQLQKEEEERNLDNLSKFLKECGLGQ